MSAVRSDERVLLSASWPGGRRYLMIDPTGDAAPEAFRAGTSARRTPTRPPLLSTPCVAGAAAGQTDPRRRASGTW